MINWQEWNYIMAIFNYTSKQIEFSNEFNIIFITISI